MDGTADRPADALIIVLELEEVPTVSEICADVLVVGSSADSYLAKGATLVPGAALATGFSRKLRNVQKLASNRMITPAIACTVPHGAGAAVRAPSSHYSTSFSATSFFQCSTIHIARRRQ